MAKTAKPQSEFITRANIAFAILEAVFLPAALAVLLFLFGIVYSNTPPPSWVDVMGQHTIYAIVAGLLLLWAVAKGWRIIDSDKKEKWQAITLFLIAKKLGISESDIDAEFQKRQRVAEKRRQNAKGK